MRRNAVSLVFAAGLTAIALPGAADAAETAVDLELVLAVDISRSMDQDEQALQRNGYVAAITNPDLIAAIQQGPNHRIALSYVEWAGPGQQATVVDWRVIDGALPPGLALEASMQDNAFLSGTPDRPGRYAFTIEATDAQGRIASHPYVVTIFTAGVTARADGTRIVKPGGEVRVDFTGTNLPAGAKWFLRSGQLPPGTTFSEAGVLTGTVPADAATRLHTFSVSVGLSAAEPLSEVWWTVEVNPVIPTKTGCTATGPELLVLGVLGLLARRRRVTR